MGGNGGGGWGEMVENVETRGKLVKHSAECNAPLCMGVYGPWEKRGNTVKVDPWTACEPFKPPLRISQPLPYSCPFSPIFPHFPSVFPIVPHFPSFFLPP